jgi:Fe-S cluster assembly protein SufD
MIASEKNIQWYLSKFQDFERNLNGEKSTPLHSLRRKAIGSFAEMGFPTNRHEEWRFTNILPITKTEFHPVLNRGKFPVSREDIKPYVVDDSIPSVVVNGIFSEELSELGPLPDNIVAGGLFNFLKKDRDLVQQHIARLVKGDENGFTALNTAFMQDGAFIFVRKGTALDRPIQIIYAAAAQNNEQVFQPRNLVISEDECRFKLIETYVGLSDNKYLTNSVTEIFLGKKTVVEHDRAQLESMNAFHIGSMHIRMDASVNYTSNSVSLGSSIARNNLTATFGDEGGECTLNGLSLGSGTQIMDNHTAIDHAKPHCNSHELYKAILAGESKGVFNGKIFVRKDAQKTDAKQTNKTLLLSDDASINTKPQLEIFADDVKCTHGATIGQLDDEQIFYLRTRGLGLAEARNILTSAFARDVIDRITIKPLHDRMEKLIQDRLNDSRPGLK